MTAALTTPRFKENVHEALYDARLQRALNVSGNFVPRRSRERRLRRLRHCACWVPAVGVGGAVSCKPWEALRAHWV